ncbi:hypothetical protein BABINDRAFT_64855 [Babjeviella inositovora NRRL Y-12698]|uniref:prephenate dehydratase n=1 Tax=Babjeviella inositovora NRRL Y-12698 TaxID=984486 RepID=A0A1E3QPN5_9ASCO|nr:uncharacterized protein BABINDRAFT_64855 [Babjeviella inositovora NRRL Y-12698]ODQ78927.1 hypothetical protein BABINDRAFT_64855 [Babjeviella inositovora NRRL Y-12698]
MTVKVAYLGPKGTYSHMAALQEFPDYDLTPQPSIGDCFSAIDKGEVVYSVVPFENSTNGQVIFTYDLLRSWYLPAAGLSPKARFEIIGEQYVNIHHCFLSNSTDLTQIRRIYSHPQVWGQCTKFFQDNATLFKTNGVERIDASSTSEAAELVIKDSAAGTEGSAAICSSAASSLYGLPVLQKNIEDNRENTTRFLVLGKPKSKQGLLVTSLCFTVNHSDAGALCTALSVLSDYGLNMTSITSRPSLLKPWQYIFFVEFYSKPQGGADVLALALDELRARCLDCVVMGTFPRNNKHWEFLEKP